MTNDSVEDRARRLLWHGMALFVLGLLTGLAQEHFRNPRMGLAAHLEGLMNGTFLLALGSAWSKVRLSARLRSAAYWASLCGTYGNWAVTTLAAIFGTAAMTPIAAAGFRGEQWQEVAATLGFVTVGLSILIASILLLIGFRRHRNADVTAQPIESPRHGGDQTLSS